MNIEDLKKSMCRSVALLCFFITFEATCSLQCAFAQTQRDKAAINNFIARQSRRERASEYKEAESIVLGDLNVDGDKDAAVLYTLEGHAGTNQYVQYLAVFINRRGRLQYVVHDVVGGKNRRAIDSVEIKEGKILLQTMEYLPTDASCCPSKKGQMRFILSRGKLKKI